MKMIINDLMQFSDLPDDLKSPSLADRYENTGPLIVTFSIPSEYSEFQLIDGVLSQPMYDGEDGVLSQPFFDGLDGVLSQPLSVLGSNQFNCLGIGGTDATELTLNGDIVISSGTPFAFESGLYEIGQTVTASTIEIEHNGTYMGRIAAGECSELCISPSREPGFYTSMKDRETISGQAIETAGGYTGEVIGVDFRYKIDRTIYEEFQRAYATQTGKGYPFFIDFNNDSWLPRNKFYGKTDSRLIFQSAVNYFKYSKRFEFKEMF